MTSVDQSLNLQAREAVSHASEGKHLVDPDGTGGVTLAEFVTPTGFVTRSTPAHLPPVRVSEADRAHRGWSHDARID